MNEMDNELEPFGIKVILIEPGAIGSNFMKGSILSKRALDPQSPYSEFVQKNQSQNKFRSVECNTAR